MSDRGRAGGDVARGARPPRTRAEFHAAPGVLVVLAGALAVDGSTLGPLDAVVARAPGERLEGVAGPDGATVAAIAVAPR